MGRPSVFDEGGGSVAAVFFSSVTIFRRSLAESVMDWVWGIAEDNELTMGWTSFAIEDPGSNCHMFQLFQDSMAIARHCGKPDISLTMTANPI